MTNILISQLCRRAICWACLLMASGVSAFQSFGFGGLNLSRFDEAKTPRSLRSTERHMFTGIVEEMGTVVNLEERDDMVLWDGSKGPGTELTIQGDVVMEGAYLGCSICVSGVCLTATELDNDNKIFKAGLAPETLRRTYLGSLINGDAVNLERASEVGGRNSGHFVQGHVDGTGSVLDKWVDQDSLWIKIKVQSNDVMKYIVPKGFIAVDGTSLTVCDVNPMESWFTLMLVEYTQKKIVIPLKEVGTPVNLEVDVLGKYAESALANVLPRIEFLEARVTELEDKLAAFELKQEI
jgi:riboflavin synthase